MSGKITASTIRRISILGVIETILLLVLSMIVILLDNSKIHAKMIVYGVLPIFVYSIGMVYLASSRPSKSSFIYAYLVMLLPFYLITPVLSITESFNDFLKYFGIVSLVSSVPFIIGGAEKKDTLRLSLLMLGYAMIATGFVLIGSSIKYPDIYPPRIGVMALYTYPVIAIFAVSVHAVPRTYKTFPNLLSLIVLLLSGILAVTSFILRNIEVALQLIAISFIAYPFAIKLNQLRNWEAEIKSRQSAGRPGNLYFIYGHYFVMIFSFLSAVVLFLYSLNIIENIFTVIHWIAMGFIGVHIYIHAPMMLPVVMGVSTKRRYTIMPFIYLLIATIIWPFSGIISYLFVVLSLCRVADIILGFLPSVIVDTVKIR